MKDKVVALIVCIVIGCIVFGLSVVAMYAAHYAPSNSIVEAFYAITTAFLWLGALAIIMGGVINSLNER